MDLQHKILEALLDGNKKESIKKALLAATENALKKNTNPREVQQILRFAAHFSLFFNIQDDVLLERYICNNLIAHPHYDQVALYVSCMASDHVEEYASFVHDVIVSDTWITQDERERRDLMKLMCTSCESCNIHFSGVVERLVELLENDDKEDDTHYRCKHNVVTLLDVLYMCSFDSTNCLKSLKLANKFARDVLLSGDLDAGTKDAELLLDPKGVVNVTLLRAVQWRFPEDDKMDEDDQLELTEAEDAMHEFACLMGFISAEQLYQKYVQGLVSDEDMSTSFMNALSIQNGFLNLPKSMVVEIQMKDSVNMEDVKPAEVVSGLNSLLKTSIMDDSVVIEGLAKKIIIDIDDEDTAKKVVDTVVEMSKNSDHQLGILCEAASVTKHQKPGECSRRAQLQTLRKLLVPRMTEQLIAIWKDHKEISQMSALLQILCDKIRDLKSCFDYDPTVRFLDSYVDITVASSMF